MTEPEFNHERTKCLFCAEWIELDEEDITLLDQDNPYVRQFGLTRAHAHLHCFEQMPETPEQAEEEGWIFEHNGTNDDVVGVGIGHPIVANESYDITFTSDTVNINGTAFNLHTDRINMATDTTVNLGDALYVTTGNHVTNVSGTSSYAGNFHVNINGDTSDNRFVAFHASTVRWNDLLFVIGTEEIGIHFNDERIAIFTKDEIQRAINSFTQKPKGVRGKIKRFLQKLVLKLFI